MTIWDTLSTLEVQVAALEGRRKSDASDFANGPDNETAKKAAGHLESLARRLRAIEVLR